MYNDFDTNNNDNNNGNSCLSSQETETDRILQGTEIYYSSEQGGATGSDLLLEKIYIGSLNLQNVEEEHCQKYDVIHTHIEGTTGNPVDWSVQTRNLNGYCQPNCNVCLFLLYF